MARLRPEQYGKKTVHTGGSKHKPATTDMCDIAKKYGLAHGYTGALGGWIYNAEGQHVAHGWGQFWYRIGGLKIRAWAVDQGLIAADYEFELHRAQKAGTWGPSK